MKNGERRKKHGKKAKEREGNLLHPNLHRKMTDFKDFVECSKIASGGICPVKESTRTVLLVKVAVAVAVKIRSQVKPVFSIVRFRISSFSALIIRRRKREFIFNLRTNFSYHIFT